MMQNVMNRRWLLAGYPEGRPTLENWTLDRQPVLDPYMRGRMSPSANGVAIGEVMQGGGVGEVVASNHPAWKVGEIAESMSFGWQEWSVLTPELGSPGVNQIVRTSPRLKAHFPGSARLGSPLTLGCLT
jgi:NADPH-dependent curcumin reductase CurA